MMTLNFDIQTEEQKTNFLKVLDFVKSLKLPVRIDGDIQLENEPDYDSFFANMINEAINDPNNRRSIGRKQLFALLD